VYDGVNGGANLEELTNVSYNNFDTSTLYPDVDNSNVSDAPAATAASADDFLGTWGDNRATLFITLAKSGNYVCTITWAGSAFEQYEWTYYCQYDEASGKLVCNDEAEKVLYTYEEEGKDPTMEFLYENGSGEFYFDGAGIRWNDLTEHAGDDLHFIQ